MVLCWNRANGEGWGIGWYDPENNRLGRYVQEGTPVWSKTIKENYPVMISHGIYSNSGTKDNIIEKLHPLCSENDKLVFAFNGNVPNHMKIREKILPEYSFRTDGDTETLANLLEKRYEETDDIFEAVKFMYRAIDGPCNFEMILDDGALVIGRSPDGNKPLYAAKSDTNKVFSFASESSALQQYFKKEHIRAVYPGEVIKVRGNHIESRKYAIKPVKRCLFEYPYFSYVDSEIDGVLVADVRRKIGRMLAQKSDIPKGAIIGPVPDSGTEFALGFAEETLHKWIYQCKTLEEAEDIIEEGIPYRNLLIKNRFGNIGRTFLQQSDRLRDNAIKAKFKQIPEYIRDQIIYLLDDSIVRGRTTRKIVTDIRIHNPKEVHMCLGFPEIRHPCHNGIDMQTYEQLICAKMTNKQIIKEMELDSITFITVDEMAEACGFPIDEFCTACIDGMQSIESLIDLDNYQE